MHSSRYDVVVVGAGLAGLNAARLLHDAGLDVVVVEREPQVTAAAMAYQVRYADVLAHEIAVDMDVDERLDPRPRILAHAAISMIRSAVAVWVASQPDRPMLACVEEAFDRGRPALEAILAMPSEASRNGA